MGGQTMSTVMSGMLWVLAAGPPAQRGRHGPDPVILILALVCVLVVVIPLCLWFSSFALRLSVSMTNKLLGGRHPTDFDYYYKRDPYARYDYIPRLRSRAGQLIPEPTNKEALLIVFLAGVINTAIQFGIGFAAGFLNESCDSLHYEPLVVKIAVVVITVPTTYVIESLILKVMLPTTFLRACVAQLVHFVIVMLAGVVILGVVILWLVAVRPEAAPEAAAPAVPAAVNPDR